MRKWQPPYNLHWAVLLNRAAVREVIIIVRGLRGGTMTGDEAYWLRRLVADWKLYRRFMMEREVERLVWRDRKVHKFS